MDNLIKVKGNFSYSKVANQFGIISKIYADDEITFHDIYSNLQNEQGIICINDYDDKGNYNVEYLFINSEGELLSVYEETEGVLPKLFSAPDNTLWVSLTSTKLEGSKEIVLPLENREGINKIITAREFPVDVTLSEGNAVMFYNYDIFDVRKPSKICNFIFDKNNLYKTRKIHKINLPIKELVLMNSEGIQAVYNNKEEIIHILINENGEIQKSRKLEINEYSILKLLNISFKRNSIFIGVNDNKMFFVEIDVDGKLISETLLFKLPENESFYNLFEPKRLSENKFVIRFNYEDGNGWAVIKSGQLSECYIKANEFEGYIDIISNNKLEININNSIIKDVIIFNEETYGVAIYCNDNKKEGCLFIRK